jgi:hypothetical protein
LLAMGIVLDRRVGLSPTTSLGGERRERISPSTGRPDTRWWGLPEETPLFSAGEYRDVIVREEGLPALPRKVAISDHDLIIDSVVKPL